MDRPRPDDQTEPNRPGTLGRNPAPGRGPEGALPDDFSVQAPAVSLPKGGGAIQGMGEKVQANPVTGSAGLQIPLPATPGRGGLTPSLALSYDSGGANGPFGLGISIGLPSIRRKTSKGLPRYLDDGEQADIFVLSDFEDLVPMRRADGTLMTRSHSDGSVSWVVQRYRPRVEQGGTLIERFTHPTTREVYWRTTSAANIKRFYGRSSEARVSDPDDPGRVFEWLLEEEHDELGNIVAYSYRSDDEVTADPKLVGRGKSSTYRYLASVAYGNSKMSILPDPSDGATGVFRFHLVFDYGDHGNADPGLVGSDTWPERTDPHSTFRSGFQVRCRRLCRRILMFHTFVELRNDGGTPLAAVPVVVRALHLNHDERATVTTLSSVQIEGWRWTGAGYDKQSLPATTLTYTQPEIGTSVQLVQGLEELPNGLDLQQWRFVDLDGEGLSGLLTESGSTWFYKRNEGDGSFAPARRLGRRPNVALGGPGVRLVDLDGDGNLDIVQMRPGVAGYQARTQDDGWADLRSFRAIPTTPIDGPDSRLVDLDGDGHADLLVTEGDRLVWYPSEARDGFAEATTVPLPHDEEEGPRFLFSRDGSEFFLADMTGDGLSDIVRIRRGNICYWPSLGYGRFGAKVQMAGAPRFDHPDLFDPGRIRLADVDGSGPTDLLYIGRDGVSIWFNQSGNRFSAEQFIAPFAATARPNEVQVSDLLGDGTACLVWSSPLLKESVRPLRYIKLMAQGKPWLLVEVSNGMGRATKLTYTASTAYYLADRKAGSPWATRLPFPVHCLSKLEQTDAVTGWRFVNEYAYHHGFFDGEEREFRGFGMVEQWDTETLRDYDLPAHADPDEITHLPPVRTRTWFHTGAWREESTLVAAYQAEYFSGDTDAIQLSEPTVPDGLSASELREAHRALKGKVLRKEIYSETSAGALDVFYTVSESTYDVVLEQAASGDAFAVFRVNPAESVAHTYDASVSATSWDPRVEHTLVLAVDDYGNVEQQAVISYPRRVGSQPHPAEQQALTIVISEAEYINQDDELGYAGEPDPGDVWHIGLGSQTKTWELLQPSTSWTGTSTSSASTATLSTDFSGATELPFEGTPSTGAVHKRLIGRQLTRYYDNAASGPLGVGTVDLRALLYDRRILAITSGLRTAVFGTTLTELMRGQAGYVEVDADGHDWLSSGRLEVDPAGFFQPLRHIDALGETTELTWDGPERLLVETVTDPAGNVVTATNDYGWMGPLKVEDPNGTESVATFDALGRVLTMAIRNGTSHGDAVGSWSAEFSYDTSSIPAWSKQRLRTSYGGSDWLESYAYSDGSGAVVQTSTQAQPDAATPSTPRWTLSGRVEVDNKGNVVRKYEPFYADSSTFDFSPAGVSSVLSYDPVGRNTQVDLPDGHIRRWVYTPWYVEAWDEQDNLASGSFEKTPSITHLDSLGRPFWAWALLSSSPEWDATDTSLPDAVWVDAFLDAHSELSVSSPSSPIQVEILRTRLVYDVQGNVPELEDARGNTIQEQTFDLLGRPLFTGAADEGYDGSSGHGETRVFVDVAGQPVHTWRSGSLHIEQRYDVLRRPHQLWVDEGSGARLAELRVYGDIVSDTPAFSKGRPVRVLDGAGQVTLSYDFKGRTTSETRSVIADVTTDSDWDGLQALTTLAAIDTALGTMAVLDSESFQSSSAFDALDRVTAQDAPDGSTISRTYDDGGQLVTVSVDVAVDSSTHNVVTDITYNARGQRESIAYGNHTESTYTYDSQRLWLDRILTERTGAPSYADKNLQDLRYTRDPVGNITAIADVAHEDVFFDNAQVSAARSFSYDATYRLVQAQGREKSGQTYTSSHYYRSTGSYYAGPLGGVPDGGDGHAGPSPVLRAYTQSYTYDPAGNLTEMKHQEGAGGTVLWRRSFTVASGNNQLLQSSIPGSPTITESYSYGPRGAMVYMPHLNAGTDPNIVADFRDQVRKAELDSSGNVAWYTYDGNRRRVRKVVDKGSVVEERLYLGIFEVWRKKDGSGNVDEERQTLHIMDDQRRVLMIETLTASSASPAPGNLDVPRLRYQLDDHLGTASLEVDHEGGVITYEEYHPYGSTAWWAEKSGVEVSQKRYRYTGQEKDDETGLGYHHHRYYMPWLGRWASADPAGLVDGVNRFGYANSHPASGNDRGGLQEQKPDQQQEAPASRPKPLLVGASTAAGVTASGVAITVNSSASTVEETQNVGNKLPSPLEGATRMRGIHYSVDLSSKLEGDLLIVELKSIRLDVSREGEVQYRTTGSVRSQIGAGGTVGAHEIEGHFNDNVRFLDAANIAKMLTTGISERAMSGNTIRYEPLDLPTRYTFPKTHPVEEAYLEVQKAVGESVAGYVENARRYHTRLMTHGEPLPANKELLDENLDRWSPYDADEFGSLFLREYAPKPAAPQTTWPR